MGFLSREELEDAIKQGGSVLIGRRVVSRLEDLPSQDVIDQVHAAKGEYVAGLAEQAQQPPDRVASATALPEAAPNSPPPTSGTPVTSGEPALTNESLSDEPIGDDSPGGKAKR